MKRIYSLVVVCVLGFMSISPASAVMLGFDDIDATRGPVEVTDQYKSEGVVFSGLHIMDAYSPRPINLGPAAPFVTGSNIGQINDESPYSLEVTAVFVDPVTGKAGVTDSIGGLFFDVEVGSLLVEFIAYDIQNNLIGIETFVTPASIYQNASISMQGIHRVVMRTDHDGTLFDNFTFNPVVASGAVPEPYTILLMGAGLLGMGAVRGARGKRKTV